jgi:hypothetical protein
MTTWPHADEFTEYTCVFKEKYGAAYRTRTCDPRITNAVLYQLS